jgi:predicted amidophosphoribosyltransferase
VIWGEYEGALRQVVLALKGAGFDQLATPLGNRLAGVVSLQEWAASIDVVVAVPSHPLRRLRVGWSAASCLAAVVARSLDRPTARLMRRHGLGRQTGRSRAQRRALGRRTFSCSSTIAGKRVLIVDDVVTTGTTLKRAAESALDAGAQLAFCAAVAAAPDARRVT